ncbi:MAG: tRNA preQ1(34) S-adenosylmethionine ribosyltransferase-isomerase QueA [Bacteroidetes bacterium]|nr:tRNA preQ1(34) S-adenosylmethionine ribosyltransferase-isomerase QueA [Bacteroidota bacterium]
MKLSHFRYKEPEELFAQYPAPNRDEARMLVVNRQTGSIEHRLVRDMTEYFTEGDCMILNDTAVFPSRLYGNKEKTGAQIEVFLLRELDPESKLWDVLVDPARKIRIGNKLYFGEDDSLVAEVIDNTTSRGRTLRFLFDGNSEDFRTMLLDLGETPLPKYIDRPVEPEDRERYQTIYASKVGAVAAPTGGLHLSKQLMKRLEINGVNFAYLTLHLGLGAFRPVEVEDLTKHKMDSEECIIPASAVEVVNQSRLAKRRVCAVDTSVLRAIESSVSTDGLLKSYEGWTNKFIFPPYDFSVANSLLTNFHRSESTLFMMVSAFTGLDLMHEAYKEAIKEKYRFLSYGDAMLIL